MKASRWAPKSSSTDTPKPEATLPAPPAALESAPEPQFEPAPPETQTADMSYNYGYTDPSMDSFAQTAGTDDLFFDDDFTPVAEPLVEQTPVEPQVPEPTELPPATETLPPQHAPRGPANTNVDRGGRGRGRGRGGRGGGRGRGGLVQSPAPQHTETKPSATTTIEDKKESTEDNSESAPPDAPSGPKDATKPAASVRGDRTLTGGPQRTRLTEEELNAKLANMRSKNETLAAAHARAEKDAANFEAREALAAKQTIERKKQAAERQKMDRQNRQQMMGERERNRQRKMDSLKGREWDVEKEDGFAGTGEERRRGAARGAHGGIAPSPRPAPGASNTWGESSAAEPDTESYSQSQRGNNRGARSRGGLRGGRGDSRPPRTANTPSKSTPEHQHPPKPSDFPELPQPSAAASRDKDKNAPGEGPKTLDFPIKSKTAEIKNAAGAGENGGAGTESERPTINKQDSFGLGSPLGPGKSWADQVEGS